MDSFAKNISCRRKNIQRNNYFKNTPIAFLIGSVEKFKDACAVNLTNKL